VKILFLATRLPWPPADGGRVLMALTIEGLLARGHSITVVAPDRGAPDEASPASPRIGPVHANLVTCAVPVGGRSRASSVVASWRWREPVSAAAQRWPAVAAAVARLVHDEPFDVVHVEQPQALSHAEAVRAQGLPIVLRAENVESDLWRQLAGVRRFWRRLVAFEAGRVSRWEARALESVDVVAALSEDDGRMLRELAPKATIRVVPPPMQPALPANPVPLRGAPAVVSFSSSWFPNRDGVDWFVREIWPRVVSALPEARLHLFGVTSARLGPSVDLHAAPAESRDTFAAGSIMAVPLRMASGARIRILEAWARGVPVVATSAAVKGLDEAGREAVRIADTPEAFADALAELAADPRRVLELIERGRAALTSRHDPDACAEALERVYRSVAGQGRPGPAATA